MEPQIRAGLRSIANVVTSLGLLVVLSLSYGFNQAMAVQRQAEDINRGDRLVGPASLVPILHAFDAGRGKIIKGYGSGVPCGQGDTHCGGDLYALDICPASGCSYNDVVIAPTNLKLVWSLRSYEGAPVDDFHFFEIGEDGAGHKLCMSLGHFGITLPGFTYGKSVPRGAAIGRLVNYPTIPHIHMGLWYHSNDCSVRDGRTALPYTGTYQLDGIDYPAGKDHKDKCVTSTNIGICTPPTPGQKNPESLADCIPELPPPPGNDNALFTGRESYPDGTVVQPGQAIDKWWRMRNTGTTTWGSGYRLAFRSGDRLGAPEAVGVPAAAPGQEVNVTVPLQIPPDARPGTYTGYWQLRNASGTYFGPLIWYSLVVPGDQPPGNGVQVQLVSLNYPHAVGPGEQFWPEVTVRVTAGQLREDRGDMLRHYSGENYSGFPHIAVQGTVDTGQTYLFRFYADHPMVAPQDEGTYESRWRVWANGGWTGPEIVIQFSVYREGSNQPPNTPSPISPADWAVFVGQTPTLCAQDNGDPDGDPITDYYFAIFESHDIPESGWISSNCWTPPALGNYGYQWHVKVRDSHGAESGWSETRHFNIESSTVVITDFHFDPPSPSNADTVVIYACTSGCGGLNVGLEALVNTATDGSANGTWRSIKQLGVPCFNSEDAPRWDTLEYAEGTHLARIVATSCDDTLVVADQTYTLLRGKPSRPFQLHPSDGFWSNSTTLTLRWQEAMRANDYTLIVGTTPDPELSPVLTATLAGTEYTATFDPAYRQLYWDVYANNEYGRTEQGGHWFGIDLTPPQSAVNPAPLSYENHFALSWSGSDADSGVWSYDVQVRVEPAGDWSDWLTTYPYSSAIFAGRPGYTYCFRSRAHDIAGNIESYPDTPDACVQVDPTRRPPAPWWDPAYQYKRNLVVVNPMGDRPLPAGYPVLLHLDSNTTPTAQELYDASLAATKGDDVRVVYTDQTEVPRYLFNFSPTQVDIWFVTQAAITAAGSSADYALYYADAAAADPGYTQPEVMVPRGNGYTRLLLYFNEGSGATASDLSGHGNNGALQGSFSQPWPEGKLWTGLYFDGASLVRVEDSDSLDVTGPMVVEAWVRPDLIDSHTRNIVAKMAPGLDSSFRLFLRDGKPVFDVYSDAGDGRVEGPSLLEAGRWYHLAGVYDGSFTRLYVDGVEVSSRSWTSGARATSAWLAIGSTGYQQEYFVGAIDQVRVAAYAPTDFSYGSVTANPVSAAGEQLGQEALGQSDLALDSLLALPNPGGGLLLQATMRNQGSYPTYNEFYIHLYENYRPSGPGDLSHSIGFWVNAPVPPSATVTLTQVLTPGQILAGAAPLSERTFTMSVQVDSTGVVSDSDGSNNILVLPGPPACMATADAYESDDVTSTAPLFPLGQIQRHNLDHPGDVDWARFDALAGQTYYLQTLHLGPSADTYLYLYDQDGSTLLAANDDSGGSLASEVVWTAPIGGTYYLMVRHWNSNAGGCGNSYSLYVGTEPAPVRQIFLPFVTKGW